MRAEIKSRSLKSVDNWTYQFINVVLVTQPCSSVVLLSLAESGYYCYANGYDVSVFNKLYLVR